MTDVGTKAQDTTEIEQLHFFTLKNGSPRLSLKAEQMKSAQNDKIDFVSPSGEYFFSNMKSPVLYESQVGTYKPKKEFLRLKGQVKLNQDDQKYFADNFDYYFKKDFIQGRGEVKFFGTDPKSGDKISVSSLQMEAVPGKKFTTFEGKVSGSIERRKKFEGITNFKSHKLMLDGLDSLAHLDGEVEIKRENYEIRSGKADIFLENFNKKLKYFVLNDDVKVVETLKTPNGVILRKSFSERLEGFTKEEKMVLSGAPRVESGKDIIKGYRITIRENSDLVEVDDAISDVEVKKQNSHKKK
jgi:lipopolysaccharide export system protein LptA